MKKLLLYLAAAAVLLPAATSCSDDDEGNSNIWDEYAEHREANISWINSLESKTNPDGSKFYERLSPSWDQESYILIHWFNDRSETAGNLRPLLTSSVRAHYIGRNYLGQVFDADSTSENGTLFNVNGTIDGWQTALQNMHVGDTVEIILPYQVAYGSLSPNSLIPPFSALKFNIGLKDVATLEVRP